jgi:hypothetical protein
MKSIAFLMLALATVTLGAGCAPPRLLIKPASAEAKEFNYIYFVEQDQEKGASSRFKRCEIAADNSAKCAVMFDLK